MEINYKTQYNPDPNYLRSLIEVSGLSQREIARRIGVNESQFRCYITKKENKSYNECPYVIQVCLELLAGIR